MPVHTLSPWFRLSPSAPAVATPPEPVRSAASVHIMPPPPEPGHVMPPPEQQLATFLFYKFPRANWAMRDVEALAVTHSPKLGIRHLVDDAFIGRVSVLLRSY